MNENPPPRVVLDISWEAILKVAGFVVGVWAVYVLREIFLVLAIVFIFVAAVNPIISRFEHRVSRPVAVSLFYVCLLLVLGALSYAFIPLLASQVNGLLVQFPTIVEKARPLTEGNYGDLVKQALNTLSSSLSSFSATLVSNATAFAGAVTTLVSALVLSFYLLLEEESARGFFAQVLPRHRYEAVYNTVRKVSDRMGSWLRGQALLMLIIGLSNLVVYVIIGVKSPIPLALWAGLCEAIPYVGPILGVLPALIVALTTGSVLQAILVVALGLVLIQQLESHIVVPRVMSKAVGLSPIFVIIAVLAGFKLFGPAGAILAIPLAAVIAVVIEEWPQLRKLWE